MNKCGTCKHFKRSSSSRFPRQGECTPSANSWLIRWIDSKGCDLYEAREGHYQGKLKESEGIE